VTEDHLKDVDLSVAAEQSSEEDEAQEGNSLSEEIHGSDAAETTAMHVVSDDSVDFEQATESLDQAEDAEADMVVEDALDVDSAEEADASVAAADDEAEVAAAAVSEISPANDSNEDPYAEFRKELRRKPGRWYVIHSYAGFEKRVKHNIENRKVSLGMEDYIFEVQVPMEDVVEIKNGQRKLVTRVRIPSYVLVRMDLNEDSWSAVRHTPGVTGFVGNAHNPTPLRFQEAFDMLKSTVQVAEAPVASKGAAVTSGGQASRMVPAEIDFEIGETITIKEGSFAGLPGTISEIKPESGKVTALVSLFERETPVELGFDQIAKL
jgi:transcriptional antiterminator NusG